MADLRCHGSVPPTLSLSITLEWQYYQVEGQCQMHCLVTISLSVLC